ncbi:hypothetical protein AN958_00261 [Leucoagaricus sp. SymC.cos]|nr:hypothetical protein AN958_00261 [Leucoagaricus sp. SymC.cos]
MLDKICHCNVLRMCMLPATNPVSAIARINTTSKAVKHLSNLYILLKRYDLDL